MTNEEAIKVMNTIIAVVKHKIQLPMTVNEIEDACYMAIEALKAETKKCPICGSDLYEYCFMCCYEGEVVKNNDT